MLAGDVFITKYYSTTVANVHSPSGALISTSPKATLIYIVTGFIVFVCGLILTRLGVSQGEGRAAQQQQ